MNRYILITGLALATLIGCQAAPDCAPKSGFELGRAGQSIASNCEAADYRDAWQLGQTLHELESEYRALGERQDELDAAERMRMRVIEREIPELEGLARIQQWLAPASLDQ
jgi:hypothetical protein